MSSHRGWLHVAVVGTSQVLIAAVLETSAPHDLCCMLWLVSIS